ncbi:hypothetical protein J6590_065805 [Homalodisca vitripennis]|nr:hypothetical protein J6590_065805 [Homalodisca vitripennis]
MVVDESLRGNMENAITAQEGCKTFSHILEQNHCTNGWIYIWAEWALAQGGRIQGAANVGKKVKNK